MSAPSRQVNMKSVLAHFAIDGPEVILSDLVIDSRDVGVHTAFVAVKGHNRDGRDFIPQAISLGAKVILCQADNQQEHGQLQMREQTIIVQFYRLAEKLSELAACFYQYPAKHLDVVAVTGTNGKTSTVQLISQLRHGLGEKAASIGTLGAGLFDPDSALKETINTTPDPCQVQRLVADFVAQGANQVALEASSHALVQKRIEGLKTDVAVFTNLTRDHLDYHGTMQEYAKAKRLLINQPDLKTLVLNFDDPEAHNWCNAALPEQQIVLCSSQLEVHAIPQEHAYCLATEIQYAPEGVQFRLCTSWGDVSVSSPLMGRFNVDNLIAALATLLALGKPLSELVEAVPHLTPVAGRMERFINAHGANVIVDYAHTPDGLLQALEAARIHTQGELYCVFGCGGDRDKGKRPEMGKIAELHSDHVIVTTDNSRSEPQQSIVEDILAGMGEPDKAQLQADRKRAIQLALSQAQPKDLILVAGKGHETYQIIGQQSLPYDERKYVENLLQGDRS